MQRKRTIRIRSLLKWLAPAVFLILLSGGLFVKQSGALSPGPLSAASRKQTKPGGYTAHADFQQECQFCHGPIHCVISTQCQDCHVDIARDRMEVMGLHGILPGTENCRNCHTEHHGHEASIIAFAYANVDHESFTGFSLERHLEDFSGAKMECYSCHEEADFIPSLSACGNCHTEADPDFAGHAEQFGDDCLACHDGIDTLASFGHEQVYALEGGHVDVDCVACHQERVFAGTSTECHACHDFPELHGDHFGSECTRCHSATAWKPAQLTRHTFHLDHVQDSEQAEKEERICQNCHVDNYLSYSCGGCHDEEPEPMQAAHEAAGVTDVDSCGTCHPTGIAGEARQVMEQLGMNPLPEQAGEPPRNPGIDTVGPDNPDSTGEGGSGTPREGSGQGSGGSNPGQSSSGGSSGGQGRP